MVHKIRSFFVAAIALAASFISSSALAATPTVPVVTVNGTTVTVKNTNDNAGGYRWEGNYAATLTVPAASTLTSSTQLKLKSFKFWSKDTQNGCSYANTVTIIVDDKEYTTSQYTGSTGDNGELVYAFPAGSEPVVTVGTTYNLSFTLPSGYTSGLRFRAAAQGSGSDGFFKIGTNGDYAPELLLTAEIVPPPPSVALETWTGSLSRSDYTKVFSTITSLAQLKACAIEGETRTTASMAYAGLCTSIVKESTNDKLVLQFQINDYEHGSSKHLKYINVEFVEVEGGIGAKEISSTYSGNKGPTDIGTLQTGTGLSDYAIGRLSIATPTVSMPYCFHLNGDVYNMGGLNNGTVTTKFMTANGNGGAFDNRTSGADPIGMNHLKVNNSGNDSYSIEDANGLVTFDKGWTLSAWVKMNGITQWGDVFGFNLGNQNYKIERMNKLAFQIYRAGDKNTVESAYPSDTEWFNLIITSNEGNKGFTVYVNGTKTGTWDGSDGDANAVGMTKLILGMNGLTSILNKGTPLIDEVALFDGVLAPNQIAWLADTTEKHAPSIVLMPAASSAPTKATATVNTDEQDEYDDFEDLPWDVTLTKALDAEITVTGSKPLIIKAMNSDAVAKSITFKGESGVQFKTTGLYNGGKITSKIPLVLNAASSIDVDMGANALTYSCIGEISPAISTTGAFTKDGTGTLLVNLGQNYNAQITVNGGTLKGVQGATYAFGTRAPITINPNATLDYNGNMGQVEPPITLAGGTLKNSRSDIGTGSKIVPTLTVTADSTIDASATFGVVASGYNSSTINLNTYTLTKIGSKTFYLINTTISGTGTLKINAGTVMVGHSAAERNSTFNNGTVELNGGTLEMNNGTFTAANLIYKSGALVQTKTFTVSNKVVCDGAAIPAAPAGDYSVEIKGTVVANDVLKNIEKTIALVDDATLDCTGITLPLAGTLDADSTGTILLKDGFSGLIAKATAKPADVVFKAGENDITANVELNGEYLSYSNLIIDGDKKWSDFWNDDEPTGDVSIKVAGDHTLTIDRNPICSGITLVGSGDLAISVAANCTAVPPINVAGLDGDLTITTAIGVDVNYGANTLTYNYTGATVGAAEIIGTGAFVKGESSAFEIEGNAFAPSSVAVSAGTLAFTGEVSEMTLADGVTLAPVVGGIKVTTTYTQSGALTINGAKIEAAGVARSLLLEIPEDDTLANYTVTGLTDAYITQLIGDNAIYAVNKAKHDFYAKWADVPAMFTWSGSGDFHNGPYTVFDLDACADTTTQFDGATATTTFPGYEGQSITPWNAFTSASGYKYKAPGYAIRIADNGAKKELKATFNDLHLGGILVEKGATGYSFSGTTGNRPTHFGDNRTSDAVETWFVFYEDFSIERGGGSADNSRFTIHGAANILVDDGKTLSINKNLTTGSPEPTLDPNTSAMLKMHGKGSLAVSTFIATGAVTLDYSDLELERATPFIVGNLTINAETKFRFPDGLAVNARYQLCSDTLTGGEEHAATIYIGDEAKDVTLHFEGNKVYYTEATVLNYETEASISTILKEAGEAKTAIVNFTGETATLTIDAEVTIPLEVRASSATSFTLAKGSEYTVTDADIEKLVIDADGVAKFIYRDLAIVPASAPASGKTYRWEGTVALDTIPYAGSAFAGTIELACPITALEGELNVSGAKDGIVFDDGFSYTVGGCISFCGDYNSNQTVTQRGGTLTATRTGSGGGGCGDTPMIPGRYPCTFVYNLLGGTFSAPNGGIQFAWDGSSTINIGGGDKPATFAAQGIIGSNKTTACVVDLKSNGVLELGAGGLTLNTNKKLILNGGTYKATATSTIQNGTIEATVASTINVAEGVTLTIASPITGAANITKTGAGTTTLTGANTYTGATTVNAGKLVIDSAFNGSYIINADGAAEFTVDTTTADYKKPMVTTLNGALVLKAKATSAAIRSGEAVSIATLPTGVDPTKVTAVLVDKDSGDEIAADVEIDATTGEVKVKLHIDEFTLTPASSSDFTWAKEGGSRFDDNKEWTDFGKVEFKTTEYTTSVALPALINAFDMKFGGIYNFSGSPLVANALSTIDGAKATFANDVVATDVNVDNGDIAFTSLTANDVKVENATIKAGVIGPSMKYVRLTVTATQGGGSNVPAVGEFRLYRGSATTGYTIVDWPIGTKISDSTGLTATKETAEYPSEVGAGLGEHGGNEKQPGTLIDGYYGNSSEPRIYTKGTAEDPAHNKWWPTSQATGPWVVTIEFPYPVATFSGCNFCLADHGPRNPTAWTIEVSSDGETWTEVSEESGVEWSTQYAWNVAADKPDSVAAENWPAFLNEGTTPTAVTVKGTSTIVADGNWTVDFDVEGALTLKGVAGKHLTFDAASASEFGTDATLTFDLSAYKVTQAGKQYVIAGPTAGWPDVDNITVIPEGVYTVGMDSDGYYVEVQSGNYWIGGAEGVGDWKLADPTAMMWGKTADSTEGLVWLNGAVANFTRNAEVTIAEGVEATGIEIAGENINVALKGALSAIATTPINISGAGATLTIENADAFDLPAITESADAAGKLVKKGAGTLTLSVNNTFTGGVTIESGTAKFGGADGGTNKGPLGPYANNTTDWTVNAVVKNGATLDVNGKQDMTYVIELEGGATFTSSSATDIDVSNRQTKMLKLSGNATIAAPNGMFGLHNGGDYETKLELGNYTLTKTGAGTFEFVNTRATGAGTLDVTEGTIWINTHGNGLNISEGTLKMRDGTTLKLSQPLTTKNLDFNGATIEGDARLTVNGTLTGSGTIPNLTLGDGATIDTTAGFTVTTLTLGNTLNLVRGNVGDTIISGLTAEPAALPAITINNQPTSLMLKYEEGAIKLAQAAAVVNGVGYATLEAAIASVETSDLTTITLYTTANAIAIPENRNIKIVAEQPIFADTFTKTGAGALTLSGPIDTAYYEGLNIAVNAGTLVFTNGAWFDWGREGYNKFLTGTFNIAEDAVLEFRYKDEIVELASEMFTGNGIVRFNLQGDDGERSNDAVLCTVDVTKNFGGTVEITSGTLAAFDANITIKKCLKFSGNADMAIQPDEYVPNAKLVVENSAIIDITGISNRTDFLITGAMDIGSGATFRFATNTENTQYRICDGSMSIAGVEIPIDGVVESKLVFVEDVKKLATVQYIHQSPTTGRHLFGVMYYGATPVIHIEESMTATDLNAAIDELGFTDYATVYFDDNAILTLQENVALSKPLAMVCAGDVNLAGTGTVNAYTIRFNGTTKVIDLAEGVTFVPDPTVVLGNNLLADATITGEGTFVYEVATDPNAWNPNPIDAKLPHGLTDGTNWTGTLWLKATCNMANNSNTGWTLNNYGNANSTIRFTGIQGFFQANGATFPGTVELENGDKGFGFRMYSGSSESYYNVAKLTGTGSLISSSSNTTTYPYAFADTTGFTGSITTTQNTIYLGTTISGKNKDKSIVLAQGATYTLTGQTWTADNGGIKINGTIGGTGTLGSNTTFGNGATIDASAAQLSVAANKTLTFGDTLTVKLSSTPTEDAPVKFLNGSFTEQTFDTALTVMVGDETITGDFLIKQDANGVRAIVNADAEWKGGTTGAETDWNTGSNWSKNKVPTAASRVTIPNDANISLTSTSIAASITLSDSATLTMDGVTAANIKNIAIPADETLTINVESGKSATVGLISGAGAVAKTGAGMLTLSGANTFAGGMEIVGGTAKANVGGTATSSAVGTGTLVIDAGATFDIGGQQFEQNGQGYTVESAGTITNSGADRSGHDRCIKNLTLTGNTSATGKYWVIGTGNGGGKTTLNMNGFTLTVAMNGGNNLSLEETEITGGGLIDVRSGRIRTNGKETYADGKIKMNGGRIEINTTAGAAMSVKDFEFLSGGFDGNIKMVVTGKFEGSGTLNHIKLADGVHIPVTSELTVSTSLELAGSIVIDLGEEESKSGTYRVLTAPNGFIWDEASISLNPSDAKGWEIGFEGQTLVVSKHALNANIEAVDGYNFGEQVIAVEVTTIDSTLKGTQIKVVTTDKTGTQVGDAVFFPIDGKENDTYDVVIGGLKAGQKYNFAVTFVDANGDKVNDSYEGQLPNIAVGTVIPGVDKFSASAITGESVVAGGAWGGDMTIENNAYVISDDAASVFGVTDVPTGNYTIEYDLSFEAGFAPELTAETDAPIAGITIGKEETDETTYWYRSDSTAETGWSKLDRIVTSGHYIIRMAFTAETVTYSVKGDTDEAFTTLTQTIEETPISAFPITSSTISSVSFKGASALAKFGAKTDDTIDTTIALDSDSQLIDSAEDIVTALSNGKTVTLKTNVSINTSTLDAGTYTINGGFKVRWINDDNRIISYENGVLTISDTEPTNGFTSFENYVLRLDPTKTPEELKLSGVAPADNGKQNTLTVEIMKVTIEDETTTEEPLDPRPGYTVNYIATQVKDGVETDKLNKVISNTPQIDLPLPDEGEVQYTIKIEVIEQ